MDARSRPASVQRTVLSGRGRRCVPLVHGSGTALRDHSWSALARSQVQGATSVRCAGLLVLAILLSALASQRALSQAAASGQVEPASFANCVAELERYAQSSGVSHATTDQITGLSPDPDVLGAVQSQAEFERPIWEYLDANVSEARVTAGRDKLAEWAGPLDAIEARFAVDRHILVAIWGSNQRSAQSWTIPASYGLSCVRL